MLGNFEYILHNDLAEGSSNGGDEVGTDMGKGSGIPDDYASDLVGESMKGSDDTGSGGDTGSDGDGIGGSGGEGIWGSGEYHGESGDDGRVDIARSLATSASDHTSVGTGAGIEILVVTPAGNETTKISEELGALPPTLILISSMSNHHPFLIR
ncbi:hypothetical protein Tco_0520354 [Tanacetum coccineum]